MGELRVAPLTGRATWGGVAVHAGVVVVDDRLVISSEHLAGGSEALAAAIQPLLDSRRRS